MTLTTPSSERCQEAAGVTLTQKWRSLKLVEECLVGLGFDSELAKSTMSSLQEAHSFRSKLKGHASGAEGQAIRQEVIKKYRSSKAHFHDLCGRIDTALKSIEEALSTAQNLK